MEPAAFAASSFANIIQRIGASRLVATPQVMVGVDDRQVRLERRFVRIFSHQRPRWSGPTPAAFGWA